MLDNAKFSLAAVPLMLLVLGFVACSDGDDALDDGSTGTGIETPADTLPTSGATDATATEGDDGAGAALTFAIGDGANDESLAVRAGDTITFVNESDEVETVTVNGINESGDLEPGESFDYTFSRAGEYLVTGDYSLEFRATITVT